MKPVSPVIPNQKDFEVTWAKNQQEYFPLPTIRTEIGVMSRWELTEEERQHIASGGSLFICQLNGGGPLQPVMPIANTPEEALRLFIEVTTEK